MEMEEDKKPILLEDLGMQYPTETSKWLRRFGLYKCGHCGKEFKTQISRVKGNYTRSCGCLVGKNYKHKLGNTKFYKIWGSMKARCYNPDLKDYNNYGGRGITVCEEWLKLDTFIEWTNATYIEGMTLDRIDNDKGYSPDNCRWADRYTQNTNKRVQKSNTSGYIGVAWRESHKKWMSTISYQRIVVHIGSFKTIEEAVQARDNYIIDNNLPHKLSSEYKKEK